ncbi:hypothetical protein ACBJ59_29130 [Nonomuraea sp. MTCD27]|uniref:hypothetical protein n=1 Tax=Nonomuraea sp. MTCD27 TaxID=1676747 RepID=UPI0035C11F09
MTRAVRTDLMTRAALAVGGSVVTPHFPGAGFVETATDFAGAGFFATAPGFPAVGFVVTASDCSAED